MTAVKVNIVSFTDNDQPGWVICELLDAVGVMHRFNEKLPIVSSESLRPDSHYPRVGSIRCTVLEKIKGKNGNDLVRISTDVPDGVKSTRGRHEFTVGISELE